MTLFTHHDAQLRNEPKPCPSSPATRAESPAGRSISAPFVYIGRAMPPRRFRGVTMIELLFVVAVLAVLASIAYVSYQEQTMRARRAEATTTILQIAQDLERCFTRFSAYNNPNCPVQDGGERWSENRWYQVTIEVPNAAAFALTAIPQGIQAGRDTGCASFTYTQTGRRGVTGSFEDNPERCW